MNNDTFVLVKLDGCAADAEIKKVIRAYISERRANEDMELLDAIDGQHTYRILKIEHIDN
jgi:hypothetical protein